MRSILPPATDLDVACQNLRAMVRLIPKYEDQKIAAEREWARFASQHTNHIHASKGTQVK